MRFPDQVTIGEKYGNVAKVNTQQEAAEYLAACVEHTMRVNKGMSQEEAETIEKSNIGYFAGYMDKEAYNRIMSLFNTCHPVFGRIYPDAETAFELGKRMGEDHKNGKQPSSLVVLNKSEVHTHSPKTFIDPKEYGERRILDL